MAQSIAGTLAGLAAACREVYADAVAPDGTSVLVSDGKPGQYQPSAIVASGWAVRMPVTRPTMGTSRSRESEVEIDVVISVFVAGDETAQATANAAALDLQALLDAHLRTQGNPALDGACYDVFVSNAVLEPDIAYQYFDDPNQAPIPTGRVADITVTVTAKIRY